MWPGPYGPGGAAAAGHGKVAAMQCPYCGRDNDKVVDSRSSEGGKAVRRRRQCLHCQRRYTTYERAEEAPRISVVKKDLARVPYDRQRIIDGLRKASFKRPVSDQQILAIVERAEEEIFRNYDKEVPSTFIGDVVGRRLREIDKVAYIRFASVYREFKDVGELIQEAEVVRDEPPKLPGQQELFPPDEGPPE